MRIFICGQKTFGKETLKALLAEGHTVTGIAPAPQIKQKDKMVGVAMKANIPIISDCERLVSSNIPDDTELVISAHSHWLISDQILKKCKYGGIGFHPSLLPRHRGQDAVRWTVHMGDAITGGTIYDLDSSKCDGGDIILQKMIFVDKNWDYHDLWREMFPIGIEMIVEAVKLIEQGKDTRTEQDERFATWEPSWDRPRLKRNELLQLGTT